jgi:hypothetical protein
VGRLEPASKQRTITINDAVVCPSLPHWGYGAVTDYFMISELYRVEFEVDGRIYADEFHREELRHAPPRVMQTGLPGKP